MKIRKYILVPVVGFLASLLISCDVSDNPVEPVEPVVNISSLGINVQLSSVIYPANASDVRVTWKSSDENVVTVSETGLMTAVNSGTATVTLQSVANPSKKATIEVHVTDDTRDDPVDPVDPVVSISSLEINVQLSSVIYPANASDVRVTWKSSDENVVTVSETGLMTTVNSGTATVTLQSVANPEIKATVEVRVADGTIDVNNEPVDQSLAEARG